MQQVKLASALFDSSVVSVYGNETDRIRRTASLGGSQRSDGGDLTPRSDDQLSGSVSNRSGGLKRLSSKQRMRELVKEAVGHIAIDESRQNLYLTAEGCVRVRRTVHVDDLVESGQEHCAEFFHTTVKPLVHGVFEKDRDCVVFVGGDNGTSKTTLMHGHTLHETDDANKLPDESQWGLAYHVMNEVVTLSKSHPCEMRVTACRLHHDHIADALVSSSGFRITKNDAKKSRQQYSRLLAISSTSALELEEVNGRFAVQDQIDCSIKETADFSHVANCFAALNSGKFYMRMGGKKASPFHFVTTIRVWRVGHDEPRYIHLVEMADFDYQPTVPEEAESFRNVITLIPEIAASVTKRESQKLKALVRESILTRIVMGNIDLDHMDMVVVGMAKFANAMRMMEYLAKCKQVQIRIVLHGPDGEGENDVDPELKQHVLEIQQRCEELAKDVAYLEDEKQQMEEKINEGKGTISRLEQQQSVMKSLASTNVLKKREGKVEVADDTTQRQTQNAGERNQLRLQALERDLRVMKEEDERRADATQQQIRFMNAERSRCAEKTALLQKELNVLKQRLEQQETVFAREKASIESEMQTKINDVIEKNRQELDAHNVAKRTATEISQQHSMERQAEEAMREQEYSHGLKAYADELKSSIDEENQKWSQEHQQLENTLANLQRQRQLLEQEKLAVDSAFEKEVSSVDLQASALCEYANVLSKLIWRLESHNSSEAKRIITYPKCGVQIFDPTMKHSSEWFETKCRAMRKWLDARGYPRPATRYDIATGVVEVLDVELAKQKAKPVVSAMSAQTDPIKVEKEVKDYSGMMKESLDSAEHSIKIIMASQQRLQKMQEAKGGASTTKKNRPTSSTPSQGMHDRSDVAKTLQYSPASTATAPRSKVTVPNLRPQSAALKRPGTAGRAPQ